jgi:hypothetical protein
MVHSRQTSKWGTLVLACVILAAGLAYWYTSASVAYPGISSKMLCEALGLSPSFDVGNDLWVLMVSLAWRLTGNSFYTIINMFGVIASIVCLSGVAFLIYDLIYRLASIHLDDHESRIAGFIASLSAVLVLALNPALWASASKGDPAILSFLMACIVLFAFRHVLVFPDGAFRVSLFWGLFGLLSLQAPFLLLIAPIILVYFLIMCFREGYGVRAVCMSVMLGGIAFSLVMLIRAWMFLGSDGAKLMDLTSIASAGLYCVRDIVRDLFAFFPRMGWILQVSFYWVPLFVVLGALRKERLFKFQE